MMRCLIAKLIQYFQHVICFGISDCRSEWCPLRAVCLLYELITQPQAGITVEITDLSTNYLPVKLGVLKKDKHQCLCVGQGEMLRSKNSAGASSPIGTRSAAEFNEATLLFQSPSHSCLQALGSGFFCNAFRNDPGTPAIT